MNPYGLLLARIVDKLSWSIRSNIDVVRYATASIQKIIEDGGHFEVPARHSKTGAAVVLDFSAEVAAVDWGTK